MANGNFLILKNRNAIVIFFCCSDVRATDSYTIKIYTCTKYILTLNKMSFNFSKVIHICGTL